MDIVCHAFPAWDGNYMKSTVELMKAIAAQGNRVLYVDYAYTWTDFFKSILGKGHASWRRMLGIQPRLRNGIIHGNTSDKLQILTLLPVLPSNFLKSPFLYEAVNHLNAFFIARQIRKAMVTLGLKDPTVVNAFNPAFGLPMAGKLGEKKLVYYCYDEISAASWAKRHGASMEERFVLKCDAVMVSSEGLKLKQEARHPHVFVVKNGVDYDLFSAGLPTDRFRKLLQRSPEEKIVGYLGSIDDRLDFDLLEALFKKVEAAPVRFVFVGRVQNEAIRVRLEAFPNVLLTGAFAPAELPDLVACMDVCLIPFVKNEFTAGIYPLKINEYLALGKPVVSTDFAFLSEFSGVAYITRTPQAFEDAMLQALYVNEKTNQPEIEQRKAFASQNSWDERARQFLAICHQNQG